MKIDPKNLQKVDIYKLLIGSVLPRPIAWVTSMNSNGTINAAPFSFYNIVATDPPMISISCLRKPGGKMKDTAYNIAKEKEFVVHVVDESNVAAVNDTSIDFPTEISEVEQLDLKMIPSEKVRVPRILHSKIQMECKLFQMQSLGGTETEPNTDFIIGEIVTFHIDDSLYDQGKIKTDLLQPVGRLAGVSYSKWGGSFAIPRPSYQEWLEDQKDRMK
ncbi:flavin reductase family protein [Hazenella coriacea]|uniref:Flavin reductase (DIM6/NTAB) family NADH-FMN oxidoreductase RutF n=1 Tax=Hazenella coriacea TaxID=1179467 RepID=A0A4R3L9U8_9BACL|nr:flavin reductase family protein [Hazenella coriacea]TCS96442.1 flavin reductase (DIM6/NTAB) family NADH-FMN oxidoreductase RutF [Hazenella coriacea]